MDILLSALILALVLWFIYRIVRAFLPRRFRATPRRMTEKCSVCKDVLNPAEITALRQGRRRCAEMTRCPYQRNRWLN